MSGKNIIDTVLDGKRIIQTSASSLGFLDGNGRLGQTTLAVTTRIFGLDAKLWELGLGDLTEELGFAWKNLPLVSKLGKVIHDGGSITSQKLSSLVVAKKTNSLSKDILAAVELDTNKLLVQLDDNRGTRALGAQVDVVRALVDGWKLLGDWKAGKGLEVSLVVVVVPVVSLIIIGIGGTFNLQDVIANLDGNSLDVGPVSDNLGTDLNVKTESVGKVSVLCQGEIALSVVFKVLYR